MRCNFDGKARDLFWLLHLATPRGVCTALLLLCSFSLLAQDKDKGEDKEKETYTDVYGQTFMIIEGDTIPRQFIDLNEVYLLGDLKFDSNEEKRKYLILKRKTEKVYPYAHLAADRLYTLNLRLEKLENKRQRKVYTKRIQRYIEGEFTDELKKLTRSEGRILVKLIHRQTGMTTYNLVKEFRTGWRAFWYNTTASLYDISLKEEFNPQEVKEDFYIEDILQRAFQKGKLELQHPAFEIDYFQLVDYWEQLSDSLPKTQD